MLKGFFIAMNLYHEWSIQGIQTKPIFKKKIKFKSNIPQPVNIYNNNETAHCTQVVKSKTYRK